MNFMMKLIGISILSAVSCSAANAHVSVSIGLPLPVIYSAPTYSYGCGHVGEPPCSYSSGSYWGPSVTVAPLGVYYDPWYWYDRGPRYHHHHHHHGYGHPPRLSTRARSSSPPRPRSFPRRADWRSRAPQHRSYAWRPARRTSSLWRGTPGRASPPLIQAAGRPGTRLTHSQFILPCDSSSENRLADMAKQEVLSLLLFLCPQSKRSELTRRSRTP